MTGTASYFDAIFSNAKVNAILILSQQGIIQRVNDAFTTAFGYETEDLQSKHFRMLFIDKDQTLLRPEIELNKTLREGSHTDENYVVHKDGTPVWVTGEAILVEQGGDVCIVKIIHNIHAQKQLERYLMASTDLMDNLFDSVKSGLLLLDSSIRTIKSNSAFLKLFKLDAPVDEGIKVYEIAHPFWKDEELKNDLISALVKDIRIDKEYIADGHKDKFRKLHIQSKMLENDAKSERRLLLVVDEL